MLSIDVGEKKVCIIEGTYRNGNVMVSSCGEIEFDNNMVENSKEIDSANLTFLVNEIIKTNRMKSKSAIITFNSTSITTRDFKFPEVKLNQLKMLINNEMLRVIGNDSNLIIDFIVTGKNADGMLEITAFAVPKEIVEVFMKILKACRLTPVAFDIHLNSISKLLSGTTINGETFDDGNIIVADIGYSNMAFYGCSGGECKFNRTINSPVQDFVKEMSSLLREDVMEKNLQEIDISPDAVFENTVVYDTCKYLVSRITDEIQRYSQYVMINSSEKNVTKIYICGGISNMKGIDVALADMLKIPVEKIEKIGKLMLPEHYHITKICNAAGALIRKA